jgi:hypothetical protein
MAGKVRPLVALGVVVVVLVLLAVMSQGLLLLALVALEPLTL